MLRLAAEQFLDPCAGGEAMRPPAVGQSLLAPPELPPFTLENCGPGRTVAAVFPWHLLNNVALDLLPPDSKSSVVTATFGTVEGLVRVAIGVKCADNEVQ